MRKQFSGVGLAVLTMLLTAGCTTTNSTIYEFDADGKVIKKTVVRQDDLVAKITEATKDKTLIAWSDGWSAYISASTATTEDPTPTAKIFAGKIARGYISLLKDQQNLDQVTQIIQATKSDLEVSSTGVSSTTEATSSAN
ncbi:MAG: hypothetical protein PHV59_00840 [Victivallales bacterium]|nr:hypothetical protein [Victivallales bacterium]